MTDAIILLEKAQDYLRLRGQEYNKTNNREGRERHMTGIVSAFNALTGQQLTVRQGWLFMVILKVARACSNGGEDTYIDMAAYAALAGEQKDG